MLNQITNLLSKDQKDLFQRKLGLETLRRLYKTGYSNLINRLWKTCKESFSIQPFNIIDIKELTMGTDIGSGTFGSVKRAYWNSSNGSIPVAVKVIQENNQAFDLSDLRGEVMTILFGNVNETNFIVVCCIIFDSTPEYYFNAWRRLC